jgi:ech hydrogenase subunit D
MRNRTVGVDPKTLVREVARFKAEGHRLATLSCVEADDGLLEILYHFDRNFELAHLSLAVPPDKKVPSISKVFLAAFAVENEIQDLFGIRFEGLAIDYEGRFYLEETVPAAPCCRLHVSRPAGQSLGPVTDTPSTEEEEEEKRPPC